MRYGCIGEKLTHSFSKEIHKRIGGYEYELIEIAPDKLDEFFRERDFDGINVTIPYKRRVIEYLDEIDPAAKRIGAVNTVVNRGGRLTGFNTDFDGMLALIQKMCLSVINKKVLILGTGGTCATATAVAESLGAADVFRVSHTGAPGSVSYEDAYSLCGDSQIIINTTPGGMYPDIDRIPIDPSRFSRLSGVVDAVYNPLRTKLVLKARSMGIPASGGLYMLVAQAVSAARHFTGCEIENGKIDEIYKDILSEKQNIVLIGMPGCGKSTVGRELARLRGCRFTDTDAIVAANEKMTVSDIFKAKGESAFRQAEMQAVAEVSRLSSRVIATGGGAILNRLNTIQLRQNGKLYFLDRPPELLTPTKDRPLASDKDMMKKLYSERYSLYRAAADCCIQVTGNVSETAKTVLEDFYNATADY